MLYILSSLAAYISVTIILSKPVKTLAKSSNNECKITIHAFSIGSSKWTTVNSYPINQTFSINLSGLEAGTYKIIVDGVDTIYRFRDTPYILDTIQVK